MAMDPEVEARAVERDIERTRNDMDATLSELERRLAPSELVHQGADSVRERARRLATETVETLQRHPVPVAIAIGLVVARFALRPSAEERLQRRADEDFERAWRSLRAGLTRAKDEGLAREAELERRAREIASEARDYVAPALRSAQDAARRGGADAWRVLGEVLESSRTSGRAFGEAASTHPVATIVGLLGLAALLRARRRR